ncbi:MAG TPA: NADAR family protein [Methanofastidiosum sp.]|nr:NADAR family protein [Methanofastidiosum sp.]
MSNKITQFIGEYRWLSNHYEVSIEYWGETFKSVEHIYQYMKATDPAERLAIKEAATPAIAQELGIICQLRPDWEKVKYEVMYYAVLAKFLQHKDLAEKLIATKNYIIQEEDTPDGSHWKILNEEGYNHFGNLIMKIRNVVDALYIPIFIKGEDD